MSETGVALISVGSAAFLAFLGWLAVSVTKLQAEVLASQRQMSLIPLAAMIQTQMLNDLHHDEEKFSEPDALIDGFLAGTITEEGKSKLEAFFVQRKSDPSVSQEERLKAEALISIMKVVKFQNPTGFRNLQSKVSTKVLSWIIGISIASIQTLNRFR